MTKLLEIKNLCISFDMYDQSSYLVATRRHSHVIKNLSFSVQRGEVVALVGASGSGKTLLADSIMGIFDSNELVAGSITFKGKDCNAHDLVRLRGEKVAFVPQSVAALDPLMRIGKQVRGVAASREEKRARIQRQRELFAKYNLERDVEQMYPYELSGGMARRVLLCCALMKNPALIIADEPTPGIDEALAKQALADLAAFARDGGGVLLITHDIELALGFADRIAVFKDGTVVEEVDVASFKDVDKLSHPFTKALWRAMPEHGLHENMRMEGAL